MPRLLSILAARMMLLAFGVCAAAFFLFLADLGLGFLGFPRELPVQFAHPPHYEQKIENMEYAYPFRTNSEGIRYPDLPLKKPAHEIRVLVLGDSFVEGTGIEEGSRFTDLLETAFSSPGQKVRFINLGLAGTGPEEYERILTHVGFQYEPDAVMICLYANDLFNIKKLPGSVERKPNPFLARFYPRITTLVKKAIRTAKKWKEKKNPKNFETLAAEKAAEMGISPAEVEAWRQRIPRKWMEAANQNRINGSLLSLGLFHPEYWTDSLDIDSPRSQQKWEGMQSVLKRIVSASVSRGLQTAMVFIPCRAQYDPGAFDESLFSPVRDSGVKVRREWLTGTAAVEQRLEGLSRDLGVPFLDLTPLIRENPLGLVYPVDGHWNTRGHEWAARTIEAWIRGKNLLIKQNEI